MLLDQDGIPESLLEGRGRFTAKTAAMRAMKARSSNIAALRGPTLAKGRGAQNRTADSNMMEQDFAMRIFTGSGNRAL